MTISIVSGNRGSFTDKSGSVTWTGLAPAANFTANNYGLAVIVIDNPGAQEGETNDISLTDSKGNQWVKAREQADANTAAATGVSCAIFTAKLLNGLLTTDTLSFDFNSQSVAAKGAGIAELSVGAGNALVLSGSNGTNADAVTSYSVVLSALSNIPHLYLGVASAENEVDATVTLDAAYSALAFGSIGSGTGGTAISNVLARAGTLAATSTGDTFNATVSASDRATILAAFHEAADSVSANVSVTGNAALTGTGLVSISGKANISPSGAATLVSVGSPTERGDANTFPTGLSG